METMDKQEAEGSAVSEAPAMLAWCHASGWHGQVDLRHATLISSVYVKLVRSKMNVRRKGAPVAELIALIRSQGLLQNLVGYMQVVDGVRTGIIEIVAGGRRLAAIGQLIAAGELPSDYTIPILLVSEEEAVDISLAENLGREPMHPADVFDAMLALAERGRSADDIGLAFGVDGLTVQRRLRLARVAPALFALYRNDKASYEQMAALAVTEDQVAQRRAWDSLGPYSRTPQQLRRLLTQQELNVRTDRVARFVGAAVFERAGGRIRRDLFGEEGDCYLQDIALLEDLAVAMLERFAARVRREGHAWVSVVLRVDQAFLSNYGRAALVALPPTEDQRKKLAAIERALAEVEQALDSATEQPSALTNRRRALRARRAALQGQLYQPAPACRALAGALVTIDQDGKPQVHRHLIRPQDRKSVEVAATQVKTRSVHSERLTRVLTGHRTAALGAEMLARPDVALVVLAESLLGRLFDRDGAGEGMHLSLTQPVLPDEVKKGTAWQTLDQHGAALRAVLDAIPAGQTLLDWLLAQPQPKVVEMLSYAVACSLDTVQSAEHADHGFERLARAVHLDMHRWWQPTADSYFSHVRKDRILEVVAEVVSPQAAAPLDRSGKQEAALTAERAVASSGWLPGALRHASEASPTDR